MKLEEKLSELREASAKKFPPEVKETMARGTRELRESGITERALRAGQKAPSFSLLNTENEEVSLGSYLERGPLVLTFYRGVW